MPARICCDVCGQYLLVTGTEAEPWVRCFRCQTFLPLAGSRPAVAAAARVHFSCSGCNLLLQGKAEQAGQLVRCPRCQTPQAVPRSAATTPGQAVPAAETPRRSLPAAPEPAAPPAVAPSARRRRPFGIGLGVAVGVLVLVAGVLGGRSLFSHAPAVDASGPAASTMAAPAAPPVSDLAFVSADGLAILSVRVADLWQAPLIQGSLKYLPPEVREHVRRYEQEFAFDMKDFERVTVVMKNPTEQSFWAVLRTTRPYTQAMREKLLSRDAAHVRWQEKSYQGYTYQLATPTAPPGPDIPSDPLAVYVASDQVFVVGTEPGVKSALDHCQRGGREGRLDRIFPLIEAGQHQILMAGRHTPDDRQMLARPAQALPESLRGMLEVQTVLLKADLSRTLKLEALSTFADADKAARARQSWEQLKTLTRFTAGLGRGLEVPAEQRQAVEQINRILETLSVRQDETELVVSAEIDVEKLMPMLGPLAAGQVATRYAQISGEANLKRLALAIQEYHDVHGRYPPAALCAADGRTPLLSWRVAILPYLGEKALYQEFALDKAWNDPRNFPLIARMPRVFEHPALPLGSTKGQTTFQLLTGPHAAFDGPRTFNARESGDGLRRTILLVEHRRLAPWTAPSDVRVPEGADQLAREVLPMLGLNNNDTFLVALFDGSIRPVRRTIAPRAFLQAIDPRTGKGLPAAP